MIWSFSSHGTFRKCPRQWFYRKVVANSRAKDPFRREAARLSKLEGVQAWRGKIVDTIISETIIPSIKWNRPCSLELAKKKADELFILQRQLRLAGNGHGTFFEVEYEQPLTTEIFEIAQSDIHKALENFFKAELIWDLLTKSQQLVAQRTLSFKHGDVMVQVRPDLIAFRRSELPVIFDWKVNAKPMRDYWLQLVTGAIALTRCKPHKDWAVGAVQHDPHETELLEVQLLAGDVRVHQVSSADIEDAEDFISASATDMQFICGEEDASELGPKDIPAGHNPRTCQTCAFRKLCWEAVQ